MTRNPLLLAALVLAICVIVCYVGANLLKLVTDRRRRREEERRGGIIDFSGPRP